MNVLSTEVGYEIVDADGSTHLLRGIIDPSVVGVPAPISSTYNRQSNVISEVLVYTKFGINDTDWYPNIPSTNNSLLTEINMTNTGDFIVDTIDQTNFRSVVWEIQAEDLTEYLSISIKSMNNLGNYSGYGVNGNTSLATFSVELVGTDIRLLCSTLSNLTINISRLIVR